MQIEHRQHEDFPVLALSGEIDLHGSPALRQALREVGARKPKRLLIDFSEVQYIDSSGLATLIEYLRDATSFGGSVALFGLKKKVRTIFELVRLNELFPIVDSAEEAAAA